MRLWELWWMQQRRMGSKWGDVVHEVSATAPHSVTPHLASALAEASISSANAGNSDGMDGAPTKALLGLAEDAAACEKSAAALAILEALERIQEQGAAASDRQAAAASHKKLLRRAAAGH